MSLRSQRPSGDNHYRPDIDGLRAVAVTMVVAFHLIAGLDVILSRIHWRLAFLRLSGGFIGVDVFFVISGYLISRILLRECDDGTFSILGFYERRIRRIIPAFAVVVLFCAITSYFNLLPGALRTEAQSSIAAIASVSNIFFWYKSGYFDNSAQSAPLLHTWSLAVEEQFYLFSPGLLYLTVRYARRHLRLCIGLTALASFAVSEFSAVHYPSAAFFLVHNRAWELLLGTLLAMGVPFTLGLVGRNALSLGGVLLILVPGFEYTDATVFPGAAALLPCLGACMLIAAGGMGSSCATWLLSLRPVVFVGLISYSLYLWHWPLIVFFSKANLLLGNPMSTWTLLALIPTVAVLSWRFVEVPFRQGVSPVWRVGAFSATAMIFGVLLALNSTALITNGLPARFTKEEVKLGEVEDRLDLGDWRAECFVDSVQSKLNDYCLTEDSALPNYLMLGSSYMADKWYGLSHAFPNTHFLQATGSNCKVLLDLPSKDRWCEDLKNTIFSGTALDHHIDGIVISMQWAGEDVEPLRHTLKRFQSLGIWTLVLGPPPTYFETLPRLLVMASRLHDPRFPSRRLRVGTRVIDRMLESVAGHQPNVEYVSLMKMLCGDGVDCVTSLDAVTPVQKDTVHFTNEGSLLVAQNLRRTGQAFGSRYVQ